MSIAKAILDDDDVLIRSSDRLVKMSQNKYNELKESAANHLTTQIDGRLKHQCKRDKDKIRRDATAEIDRRFDELLADDGLIDINVFVQGIVAQGIERLSTYHDQLRIKLFLGLCAIVLLGLVVASIAVGVCMMLPAIWGVSAMVGGVHLTTIAVVFFYRRIVFQFPLYLLLLLAVAYSMYLLSIVLIAIQFLRFAPNDGLTIFFFALGWLFSTGCSALPLASGFCDVSPSYQRQKAMTAVLLLVAAAGLSASAGVFCVVPSPQIENFPPEWVLHHPNCTKPHAGEVLIPSQCADPVECFLEPAPPVGVTYSVVGKECVLAGWADESAFATIEYRLGVYCTTRRFRVMFANSIHITSSSACLSPTVPITTTWMSLYYNDDSDAEAIVIAATTVVLVLLFFALVGVIAWRRRSRTSVPVEVGSADDELESAESVSMYRASSGDTRYRLPRSQSMPSSISLRKTSVNGNDNSSMMSLRSTSSPSGSWSERRMINALAPSSYGASDSFMTNESSDWAT